MIIIIKPNFVYDHDKFRFKKFGYTKDKSIFSIETLSVIFAIIIIMIFSLIGNNKSENAESDELKFYRKIFGGNLMHQYIPYLTTIPPQIIQMPQQIIQVPPQIMQLSTHQQN